MKRMVTSTKNSVSSYTTYNTYQRGRRKYAVHSSESNNPTDFRAQIREIHPYDDAEYVWARIGAKGAAQVEFIQDGKIIDKIQLHYYEDDDYEDVNEYYDEIIDCVCVLLTSYNKDVEPVIVHN